MNRFAVAPAMMSGETQDMFKAQLENLDTTRGNSEVPPRDITGFHLEGDLWQLAVGTGEETTSLKRRLYNVGAPFNEILKFLRPPMMLTYTQNRFTFETAANGFCTPNTATFRVQNIKAVT